MYYTYTNGYLTKIERRNGDGTVAQTYTFTYDMWGNTTQISVGDRTLATYTYAENNGNLTKMTYGNGTYVEYIYESPLDRVKTVKYNGSVRYEYVYTSNGSLDYVKDLQAGTVTYYVYDGIGRLVREAAYTNAGVLIDSQTYTYDEYNRTDKVITNVDAGENDYRNTQTYTYDNSDGSLSTLYNMYYDEKVDGTYGYGGDQYTYTYDYLKRLSTKKLDHHASPEDALTATYTYETLPLDATRTTTLVNTIVYQRGSKGSLTFGYNYDNIGNILQAFVGANSTGSNYRYDEFNQLIEEYNKDVAQKYYYTYDAFGNILTKQTTDANGNPFSSATYTYDSRWRDLLISYNGKAITYDAIGNPLTYNNGTAYTFTWADGRRLMSAVVGNTTATQKTLSFTYEDGIRKTKTVDGVTHNYYYSGGVLVMETWEDEVLYFLYDESASPYAFVYFDGTNYNTYYYFKNLQGDVICILDKEMNILVLYTYDAWGNILGTYDMTSGMYDELNYRFDYDHIAYINPFRYRGYYYDNETNLYYLQSRYYDPAIGRFINSDREISSVGELIGFNLFQYCYNNPVEYIDHLGNRPEEDKETKLVKGILAVGVGLSAIAAVALTGGSCIPAVALAYSVVATAGTTFALVGSSDIVEYATGTNPVKDVVGEKNFYYLQDASASILSLSPTIIDQGLSTSVCFIEGTLVASSDALKPIEEISVGDYVFASNPETGDVSLKRVTDFFVNKTNELVHIFVNGEKISTTPEHPFWVSQKGWVKAINLQSGDVLQLLSGEYVVIEAIQYELLEVSINVYNFEVQDYHTYFVGQAQVLVHNKCGDFNYNGLKDLRYVADRGWTRNMINYAINNGRQGTSVNMATGNECIVYQYPGIENQYVVIDSVTRSIVQVSDFYDPAWIPDSRIIWDP